MKYSKPTIFVSHIHENKELASIIKDLINTIFENALNIFVSSDSESIDLGDEWPVSYTHLDVYKRQDIFLPIRITESSFQQKSPKKCLFGNTT